MSEPDPHREQITRMLTDLANDPAAPPSTVDALSVIRAARAASAAGPQEQSTGADESGSVPDRDEPMPADVVRIRPRRRRTALIALVAAASLAAVAALVIPLGLSGGSSTNTSADAERAVAESAAGAAAQVQSTVAAAAPGPGTSSAVAAVAPPVPAAGSAAAESAPADGFLAGTDCWPALTEPVAAALGAALPAGTFGAPEPLLGDCPAGPVGGAFVPGSIAAVDDSATAAADSAGTTGTALVVRISHADPGACVTVPSAGCVPQQDGTYLATGGSGGPTVYAYGHGDEVAIGGAPDTGAGTGLSADQLAAAARAVLGALG